VFAFPHHLAGVVQGRSVLFHSSAKICFISKLSSMSKLGSKGNTERELQRAMSIEENNKKLIGPPHVLVSCSCYYVLFASHVC